MQLYLAFNRNEALQASDPSELRCLKLGRLHCTLYAVSYDAISQLIITINVSKKNKGWGLR